MARDRVAIESFELGALLEDLGMGGHRLSVDQTSVASLKQLIGYGLTPTLCQACNITDEEKDKLTEWIDNGGDSVASSAVRCFVCKCSEETIKKRGRRPDGTPAEGERTVGGLIDFIDERPYRTTEGPKCRSCIVSPVGDGRNHLICGGCGFSETLSQICMLGTFYDRWSPKPTGDIRCPTCRDEIAAGRRHESRFRMPVVRSAPSPDISDSEDDLDMSDSDEEDLSLIPSGVWLEGDDSFEDEIYLSDSVEDGGLADLGEQDNNGENVALEEALGRTEVEMFGPMGPGRHGDHIDRIECLETHCGIVVLDAQNDRLMERLRAVVNILGIDVPGIYSLGDEEDPYDGELDLEEETEDNNEETAMSVKKTVQEMGELLFDIKDKISEGEYLKLMDGLQSITNEMNQ
jgi:hypothetical protein